MKDQSNPFELNILIGGRPITEYSHESNVFVEGRKGSEFEVEFKNRSSKQVLIVPSVDGKSVFDGKPATPSSQGYIISPYGSIRIPGWTLDNNAVAKFTFEDKDKSYSAAMTQEGQAVVSGVIGVIVFEEKEKPNTTTVIHHHHPYPVYPSPTSFPRSPTNWPYSGPMWSSGDVTCSSEMTKSVFRGANTSATLSASCSNSAEPTDTASDTSFDMGAGFGPQTSFKTTSVAFQRGSILCTMILYYDSRKNLEKRGIQVAKKDQRYLNELPPAFIGTGCTPPPGWAG
jgi:hypothetical protein